MNTDLASPLCAHCRAELPEPGAVCPQCGRRSQETPAVPWWHLHRRAYDWTLAWANRPSAAVALFVLSFAESSFFPIPPDVLLMPLTLGNRRRWFRYAFLCSLASVLGAVAGYLIGWLAWAGIGQWVFENLGWMGLNEDNFAKAHGWYEDWNFWIVFTAGFTPIPFKVITITAGAFFGADGPMFLVFLAASAVSRSARFFLVAGMMRLWGARIAPFIERYFNWLALAFTALLIGGFVAMKYVH